jgi:hypothetical protein
MFYTFTVPLEGEEHVDNDAADLDDDHAPKRDGMVEMSVLMRPVQEPGWRRNWRKGAAVLLALGLVGAVLVRAGAGRPAGGSASTPAAQQSTATSCADLAKVYGAGGTPGGAPWENAAGQNCDQAKCRDLALVWGVSVDAACCKCGGGRRGATSAGGDGQGPAGEVHAANNRDVVMSTGAWNCTDEMYNAMEEACAASATGTRSKHSVGPYLCSPRCRALLTGTLANCIVPVARWPETAAFAQLLDLHYVAADKDTGTDGATSDARDETMTLDVVEMVQVRHKYSRHDSRDAIIIPDPTHPPGDIDMQQHSMPPCPPGILGRCFQLTSLDEIYVLFDVAPLVEGRYTITGASVRVSAFVVNHAEQLSEEVANIQLSKCEAEPIKSLVQASKNGKSWHKAVAGMSHHCSPVCAEASVFGPTTFDISYFPDEAPTTKGSTHLGLRLTSDSQVPLNYAALRLEVTVTKNHDRYHLALAGARTPSCPCPCPCPCSGPCLSLSSGGALLTPLCVLCPACGFLLDHRRPTEPCCECLFGRRLPDARLPR